MMTLTANQMLPHYEYEKMEITIETWTNETRIDIEIKDGYGDKKNSRVSMSIEDFDRVAEAVATYRKAQASIEKNS